ncbi:hypothetical protein, partial [Maritalea porphyrae]|uniref:hypothetical protein n=1 Tax=Maritalea porphyrae TaxID=880732 RepID=UPI0022B06689
MSFRRSLRDILGLDKLKIIDRRFFERLLDAIDLRLKPIENSKADYDTAVGEVQTVALERINNVLTPAIEHIQTVQDKG